MGKFELKKDGLIHYSETNVLMEFDLEDTVKLLNLYEKSLNQILRRVREVNSDLYDSFVGVLFLNVFDFENMED